ncbi:hypothetical protein R3P38DRAFT_2775654 [Favolaschia claudopus]|uniref:Uncharacterized protein n=1 Tax=Favolaschia claudopus TaxID=2862362 RepID=A0AAW0BQ78_9AGAR
MQSFSASSGSSSSFFYDQSWSDAITTSPVYGQPWGDSPSNWHRTHGPSLEDLHLRLLSLETTLMMWDLQFGLLQAGRKLQTLRISKFSALTGHAAKLVVEIRQSRYYPGVKEDEGGSMR